MIHMSKSLADVLITMAFECRINFTLGKNLLQLGECGCYLASFKPGKALAAVFRDHDGLLLAIGKQIKYWDSTKAELIAVLAIKDAIQDWILEKDGIIIEGDCESVIKWFQNTIHAQSHSIHMDAEYDISFFMDFKPVLFHYIPRESNSIANFCASFALFGDFVWKGRKVEVLEGEIGQFKSAFIEKISYFKKQLLAIDEKIDEKFAIMEEMMRKMLKFQTKTASPDAGEPSATK
ncbi:hypothetical protein M5K25_015481 [Dendrobium thyrsiflorum]|uniref:RNase H type-1 domain-containing protein n=1 Tax=Dendrobium thyrsiflorum TaxID=117978 RepID=A0ABD0UR90_DENTH